MAIGSKVGIPTLSKSWRKKAIVSFPARPRLGAADAAKKRAAFRSPEPPLAGDGGVSRPGTEAWRGWQGFGAPPFPGGLPGALRTGAKLHRRLVITDDPTN